MSPNPHGDLYGRLMGEPLFFSIEQIGSMTQRQIYCLVIEPEMRRKEKEEAEKQKALTPETEADVRGWCLTTGVALGMTQEAAQAWAERAVEKWRSEQSSQGS